MLRDVDIKYRYSTGSKDTPIQFFTDTLSNSVNFDLGLGFLVRPVLMCSQQVLLDLYLMAAKCVCT